MSKSPEQPNHEIHNPIETRCPTDKHSLTSTYNNTLYQIYRKQPWFNNLKIVCDKDECSVIYWQDMGFPAEYFEQFECYEQDFCDDSRLIELRGEYTQATPPEEIWLSPRREEMVKRWGEFLQNQVIDNTDFFE